jgi:pre-mRNA-splicing helicase BRR2
MSKKPDLSQYNYGAISSLVLTADRSALPRRDKEPDGAPTSLVGRIDPREMGSRVIRQAPKDMQKKKKKIPMGEPKRRPDSSNTFAGYADILQATQDAEGLSYYRPKTAETREAYELLLSSVHSTLGDQAQDIVQSAADAVLETLKNESMKDFDKKKEAEEILGPISANDFAQFLTLSKKLTDYGAEDDSQAKDPDLERKEAEIDDEVGVAVVFDEEEEDDDEEEGYEVRDEDEDGEDEDAEETAEDDENGEPATAEDDENGEPATAGEDELVIGGEKANTKQEQGIVSPHEIDAFWVQRMVSEIFPDPATAAAKASDVLSILGSESSARDCENQLMEVFDYQSFDVTTKFLRNREAIVWCTKLMRSDAEERVNVEVAMREKGVGWILRALAGDRKAKTQVDAMDVESREVPKTATIAPGSTVQPKRVLDLESMAFGQGGHLMSNKKCKLPDGSFKRSKKGYEEIHVPAPKAKPLAESELVPIADMPIWAREAFTVPKLNRVQSKLYPIAFGTDEPVLLCAPTGAGKVCKTFSGMSHG